MKKNYWLILAALALMGLLFVPGQAHSADFHVVTAVPISFTAPVMPAILPTVPLPGPRPTGSRPTIQLPSPNIPIPVSLPTAFVPRPMSPPGVTMAVVSGQIAVFPAARKRFGSKTLTAEALDRAFDNAPAPKPVPPVVVPQDPKDPDAGHQTLPETDLEEEIGIH